VTTSIWSEYKDEVATRETIGRTSATGLPRYNCSVYESTEKICYPNSVVPNFLPAEHCKIILCGQGTT